MANKGYKAYVLVILTTVYMLNLVDRGLMMLLLQPIKEDLHLSDTQLGLLTGMAFSLFYATLGIPIARWADRGNRASITALAIGLWGVAAMTCLLVANFIQLVLARIAAAIGEAGCKPPTYSLVGDYFSAPSERIRAMSIYLTGNPLSALVSFVVGGFLATQFGWRATFFIVGVPGILLGILVHLTIKDPRSDRASYTRIPPPSMSDVFQTLWRQRSSRHICLALIFLYTIAQGLGPWYAAYLMRSHGFASQELGLWMGLIFAGGGVIGTVSGGWLTTRKLASDERTQMRMVAGATALMVLFLGVFLLTTERRIALACLAPIVFAFNLFLGPTYSLMQRLAPESMRATTMALIMLLVNLIGSGLGPLLVGIVSDLLAVRLGENSLRYAMLGMSPVAIWSAWHFWRVGATVEADLRMMEKNAA